MKSLLLPSHLGYWYFLFVFLSHPLRGHVKVDLFSLSTFLLLYTQLLLSFFMCTTECNQDSLCRERLSKCVGHNLHLYNLLCQDYKKDLREIGERQCDAAKGGCVSIDCGQVLHDHFVLQHLGESSSSQAY